MWGAQGVSAWHCVLPLSKSSCLQVMQMHRDVSLCAAHLSAFSQASYCLLVLLDLFQLFQAFFAFLCFPWHHTDVYNCVSGHSKIFSFAAGPPKKYLNSEFRLRAFFSLCSSLKLSVIWDTNTLS